MMTLYLNHQKHLNTLCLQKHHLCIIKKVAHRFATLLQRLFVPQMTEQLVDMQFA
jgi:hypothetical protein